MTEFQATFSIDSPSGEVTGTKTLALPEGFTGCSEPDGQRFLAAAAVASYEATIVLPDGTRCTDTGTAKTSVTLNDLGAVASQNFGETFQSAQGVALCGDFGREDCTKDSAVFKNRGDCVAFFATEAKNEPGKNLPRRP